VSAAPSTQTGLVELSTETPIWERFFTVAPLVLVATREGDGHNVAPKHLAMPFGRENYFGFVCSPRHSTYRNLGEHPEFTVSFPGADRLLQTSMAAGGRLDDLSKPSLAAVPLIPARVVDGVLVEGCVLYLECALERVIDGFGENSIVVGRVVAAAAPRRISCTGSARSCTSPPGVSRRSGRRTRSRSRPTSAPSDAGHLRAGTARLAERPRAGDGLLARAAGPRGVAFG
jgi:flavin reductase (DIM6/NTAB) family NADH-FMN oxidoreductase RutF